MNSRSIATPCAPLLATVLLGSFALDVAAAEPAAAPLTRSHVSAEHARARESGELASPGDLYRPVRDALLEVQRVRRAQLAGGQPQLAAALAPRAASAPK